MNQTILVSVFTAGLLLTAVPAQTIRPDSAVRLGGRTPPLYTEDGVIRGRGRDYSAQFDERGIEYVPALDDATATYPLRLALASVSRGGIELCGAGERVRPRIDGPSAVYDRAPGLAERYRLSAAGVELSYELQHPPGGTGALLVRLALDTELAGPVPVDGELRLWTEGLGGVRVGGVTGIDAAGRTTRGTLRFDAGHIELALPAAFVDAAAYPLVLDPLISTEFPIGAQRIIAGFGVADERNPDVAYDATGDHYLIVWQANDGSPQPAIECEFIDSSGTSLGGTFRIQPSTPGTVALHPTVCYVRQTGVFLVCWQEAPSILGPWVIRGKTITRFPLQLSSAVTLVASASTAGELDVAGDPSGVDNEAILVWEEAAGGIRAATVRCPNVSQPPAAGPPALLDGSGAALHPAISKSADQSGRHLVVWQRLIIGFPLTVDVFGAVLDRDANVLVGATAVASGAATQSYPDVDGNGTNFLVAWRENTVSTVDIMCREVRFDGVALQLPSAPNNVSSDALEENDPAVAFLGTKYGIAWRREQASALSSEIRFTTVSVIGCVTCDNHYTLGTTTPDADFYPELASQISGGGSGDEAMCVFVSLGLAPPFRGRLTGQFVEAVGAGGSFSVLGGGCGQGGTPGINGPLAIGNRGFAFTLTGADPRATVATFVLAAPGPPLSCGPCEITVPLVYAIVPVAGGNATLRVPLPCTRNLLGGQIEVQWWPALIPGSPCPLLPFSVASDRAHGTVGL